MSKKHWNKREQEIREDERKKTLEQVEKFKNRINKFGFTTNLITNQMIRKQVLEILEEELKQNLGIKNEA